MSTVKATGTTVEVTVKLTTVPTATPVAIVTTVTTVTIVTTVAPVTTVTTVTSVIDPYLIAKKAAVAHVTISVVNKKVTKWCGWALNDYN